MIKNNDFFAKTVSNFFLYLTIKQAMIKNGFKLIRFFRVKDEEEKVEYCFAYKGVSIDIFFYVQKENVALSYSFTPIIGMCRLNYPNKCGVYSIKFPYTGFRQILFKGNLYNVPLQTDKYLSAHYGVLLWNLIQLLMMKKFLMRPFIL